MLEMTLMVWLTVKFQLPKKQNKTKQNKTVPNYYGEQIIFSPSILIVNALN